MKKESNFILLLCASLSLLNFMSCGFAYEKRVIGKYYIIGVDSKQDLSLSYSINGGNYVGKAPGQLKEYGFNDTVLVVKTLENGSSDEVYYIIDMSKDSEYAHEADFRIGPLSENDFARKWSRRLSIEFKTVQ